mmetsp:Transcript_25540/g.52019  ORF Transcript_25540/g.52019 Transcript_25540/m.52019 type:complete len:291 (+) Transcript_25540:1746-2618(+)
MLEISLLDEDQAATFSNAIPVLIATLKHETLQSGLKVTKNHGLLYNVLANLSFTPDLAAEIARHLDLADIVAALDASSRATDRSVSDMVERSACQVVSNFAFVPGKPAAMNEHGVVPALLKLLLRSLRDSYHVQEACSALECVLEQAESSKEAMRTDQAQQTIQLAMSSHTTSPRIQASCCRLLALMMDARVWIPAESDARDVRAAAGALQRFSAADDEAGRGAAQAALAALHRFEALSPQHATTAKRVCRELGVDLPSLGRSSSDASPASSGGSGGFARLFRRTGPTAQ